jgi:hypothetical protein
MTISRKGLSSAILLAFLLSPALAPAQAPPAPAPAPPAAPGAPLVDLGEDFAALKSEFDASVGDVRMLLILSPNCQGCQEGSREVEQKLLERFDPPNLKVFVVWFPLLKQDSREAAQAAMSYFPDPRVTQYWLPSWKLANLYGGILEFPKDYRYKVAVDVYMVFDHQAQWGADFPRPVAWMHRLGDDERFLDAEKLRTTVEGLVQQAVAHSACKCGDKKDGGGEGLP